MMRKKFDLRLLFTLLTVLVLMNSHQLTHNIHASSELTNDIAASFISIKGKTAQEREAYYESMALDSSLWEKGMVLSKDPFAVVYDIYTDGEINEKRIRIWTGLMSRVNDHLLTYWDEIWVDHNEITFVITNFDKVIPNYFLASNQQKFQTDNHIGIYPWVNIPTDEEAHLNNLDTVSDSGVIDLYDNDFGDEIVDVIAPGPVKTLEVIPEQIDRRFSFEETTITDLPDDIHNHWAKDYIIDLMGKGIIVGYEDGTIRPESKLTLAEFVTLLLRTIQPNTVEGKESSYIDVPNGYWARDSIITAEYTSIIPRATEEKYLEPDAQITRIEMALLLSNALKLLNDEDTTEIRTFSDTKQLTSEQQQALNIVSSKSIIDGYEDGSFKPNNSLTRAEAFTVISRLIAIE